MELLKILLDFLSSLAWPVLAVFFLIYFKKPITILIEKLKSAKLPGGTILNFDERLKEARDIANDISTSPDERNQEYKQIPITEANKLLIERGLRPSPSGLDFSTYKKLASEDPVLALAELRTEIESMVKNLSDGFGIDANELNSSAAILAKLKKEGAIYQRQYYLGKMVIKLCNSAIHGVPVTRDKAETIIDIATVLASEYLDWLGWGFTSQT